MSEYEKQRKDEKQLTKELAIADIKEWITKLPAQKANTPAIVVGTKTFTPQEMQKEVENDTEYGKEFAKILSKSRVELSRRKNK
jgi:GTPase SAR1 family protein